MNEASYREHFMMPHPCAREVTFHDGETLVGVGFIDETPHAMSAIYFFYDPSRKRESLGTANVLAQVEWAKAHGKKWVYLGFNVAECPSLAYKGSFHTQEVLVNRPALDGEADWHRVAHDRVTRSGT